MASTFFVGKKEEMGEKKKLKEEEVGMKEEMGEKKKK